MPRKHESDPANDGVILGEKIRFLRLLSAIVLVFSMVVLGLNLFKHPIAFRPGYTLYLITSTVNLVLIALRRRKTAIYFALSGFSVAVFVAITMGHYNIYDLFLVPLLILMFLYFTSIRTTVIMSFVSILYIGAFWYRSHLNGTPITTLLVFNSTLIIILNYVFFIRLVYLLQTTLGERNSLIREISHRLFNSLQMVSNLVRMQIRKSGVNQPEKLGMPIQACIQALSSVHRTVYHSPDLYRIPMEEVISQIARQNQQHYPGRLAEISVSASGIITSVDKAAPLAIIINELLSNSLKHGLSGDPQTCRISITLTQARDNTYQLIYTDSGSGLAIGMDTSGQDSVGFYLIQAMTEQLNGKSAFSTGNPFRYTLDF